MGGGPAPTAPLLAPESAPLLDPELLLDPEVLLDPEPPLELLLLVGLPPLDPPFPDEEFDDVPDADPDDDPLPVLDVPPEEPPDDAPPDEELPDEAPEEPAPSRTPASVPTWFACVFPAQAVDTMHANPSVTSWQRSSGMRPATVAGAARRVKTWPACP
jgi:hypothetical protein